MCRQTYKYADHSEHIKECLERYEYGASCIFSDDCTATFKTVEHLKEHLESDCPSVIIKCKTCDGSLPRKDKE